MCVFVFIDTPPTSRTRPQTQWTEMNFSTVRECNEAAVEGASLMSRGVSPEGTVADTAR